MAKSPSHRFGQIIGDILELMLRPTLQAVADKHGLYLDYIHPRVARNNRPKVTWTDYKGNNHNLDYVLEVGGSEAVIGKPKAFIETAWRRYTKHSRNKAQEIQGAISPLAETYSNNHPFLGCALGGVFTSGSLSQLKSHNFHILYYPYDSVVQAFAAVGIDARSGEATPDADFQAKVDAYEGLSAADKERIGHTLVRLHQTDLDMFVRSLEVVLTRTVETVYIVALHGSTQTVATVAAAIALLDGYSETDVSYPFVRYEVVVRYTNGNNINGEFNDKASAIEFLRQFV